MYKVLALNQQQYGPVTAQQLRQWIAEGRVNADTLIQPEGATEWKPLRAFPEFATPPAFNQPAPQIIAPNLPPGSYGRQSNGLAVTGMIMGILALTIGWFCCGFGPFFGILGLIFSCIGLTQINQNPERYSGRGMAITGIILSAFALVLHFTIAVLFGLFSAFGKALGRIH